MSLSVAAMQIVQRIFIIMLVSMKTLKMPCFESSRKRSMSSGFCWKKVAVIICASMQGIRVSFCMHAASSEGSASGDETVTSNTLVQKKRRDFQRKGIFTTLNTVTI